MAEDEFGGARNRNRRHISRPSSALGDADDPSEAVEQPRPLPVPPAPSIAQLARRLQATIITDQTEQGGNIPYVSTQAIPSRYSGGFGIPEQSHRQQQQQELQSHEQPAQTTSIIGISHRGCTSRPIGLSNTKVAPFTNAGEDKIVELVANYVKVNFTSDIIVYQYHVHFSIVVPNVETRIRLVSLAGPHFHQVYIYDKQSTVMATTDLGEAGVTFCEPIRPGGPMVEVKFRRTREISIDDEQMMHCFNTQLRNNMERMGEVQILRHFYDMNERQVLEQHKLEVIPGIVNSIKNCKDGLLMNLDTIHKVLHQKTVLDVIKEVDQKIAEGIGGTYERELVGMIVLTRYNNRTYRICGVERSKNPTFAFNRGSDTNPENQIPLVDYYRTTYNIVIRDLSQVLLLATASNFERKQKSRKMFLVPELCYITGLTPNMQTNYDLKQMMAQTTQLAPRVRIHRYNAFLTRLNTSAPVQESLRPWKISYDNQLLRVKGTLLAPERILLGGRESADMSFRQRSADFTREIKGKPMYRSCTMTKWHVVCNGDESTLGIVNFFLYQHAGILTRELGIRYELPTILPTQDESPISFLEEIGKIGDASEMIMVVLPNNRKNTYDDVKRHLCCEVGVPSQCVLRRTLFKKNMSISSKIMIQIACKVGAEPWVLNMDALPKGLMIIGIDVCRDKTKRKKSVDGFVASINNTFSLWFNKISYHQNLDDTSDHLNINLGAAFRAYKNKNNGAAPDKILVLRDGISEGQYKNILETELKQLKQRAHQENPEMKITLICISKRINTRLFSALDGGYFDNPVSGTVVDDKITNANIPQFFLVSQMTNQGTVSPTSYDVIEDGIGWPLVEYQRLMYKLCHLYYNWTGLVSVPSPIQYAHKLAYLAAGSFSERNFREDKLSEQLFYL